MIRLLLLMGLLLLSSCASFTEEHSRTLMIDRSTGEMKECMVDRWRVAQSYEKYRECINSLERQGYTIWSQY